MKNKRVVAAFDFDGTITYRDSLLPFILMRNGVVKTLCKTAPITPTLIGYLLGNVERQRAKEAILTAFFRGRDIEELKKAGEIYANGPLKRLVRKEALERIAWHVKRGDQCLLISASIDIYLLPWAKPLGFSEVISSKLELSENNTATGKLLGANCWGEEKMRRLEALLGPRENYTLYAYGDSKGDGPLLAAADYPFYRTMG